LELNIKIICDGEDPMESLLPSDQEEEYVADWFIVMLYGLYLEKDETL
jgi:hypothetical protein